MLIAQFLHLASESSETPISLYLNSPGGSPGAALAVYDTMQHIRPDVATTCVGQAGGPAAVLLAGGAKGSARSSRTARVTLHQPSTQGRGTVPDLILHADEVVRVRAELEAALAADTGRDEVTLRHDTDRDLILPAAAARRLRPRRPRARGAGARGRGRHRGGRLGGEGATRPGGTRRRVP